MVWHLVLRVSHVGECACEDPLFDLHATAAAVRWYAVRGVFYFVLAIFLLKIGSGERRAPRVVECFHAVAHISH